MDKKRNLIVAVLFVVMIVVTGVGICVNSISGGAVSKSESEALQNGDGSDTAAKNGIAALPDKVDGEINQAVPGRYSWINVNGLFQKSIGRRLIEDSETDVYRMKNGQLIYGADTMEGEIDGLADSVADFSKDLSSRGIPLLYVQLPYKIENGTSEMPSGTTEYANSNATDLVMGLDERNVKALDLRDESVEAIDFARQLDNHSGEWADLFYDTDQH